MIRAFRSVDECVSVFGKKECAGAEYGEETRERCSVFGDSSHKRSGCCEKLFVNLKGRWR